jgi:hypothetical protein
MEYTHLEIFNAFQSVCDKADWRGPIDSTVSAKDADKINLAVIHYTGAAPTFTPIMGTELVRVVAEGYYRNHKVI